MKRYIIIVIIGAVLAYALFGPGDNTSEIEAVFNKAIEAGEKKDFEGVMEHFSLTYRDEYGATYPVVKKIVKNSFEKFDALNCKYADLKVSINETEKGEKEAVANFNTYISGISFGIPVSLLGGEDSLQNLTVTLKKSSFGEWKIIKVEGLEAAEGEF